MKFKMVSMFILLYHLGVLNPAVYADGIPLSQEARRQIESIAASFADYTSFTDIDARESGLLLGGDLYSIPALQQVDVMTDKMPPFDGMPSLQYLSLININDENLLLWQVRGGFAILRGAVVSDFAYSQGVIGGDAMLVHRLTHYSGGIGVMAQYTSGDVAGSFLVEGERSHVSFTSLVPGVRLVLGLSDYHLSAEAAFFAARNTTRVKLGEGGQPLEAVSTIVLGTALAEYSLSYQIGRYVVSAGRIHDSYHSSFYRVGLYRYLN